MFQKTGRVNGQLFRCFARCFSGMKRSLFFYAFGFFDCVCRVYVVPNMLGLDAFGFFDWVHVGSMSGPC